MAPFFSDRYTADPFPVPRFYSSPFSAASSTVPFPPSATSAPRPSSSLFHTSPSSSLAPAEPPLPAASSSPPSLPLPGSSPSNTSNAVSLPGLRWDDTAQTAVGGIGGITASVFGGRVEVWRPAQVGRGERGEGWKAYFHPGGDFGERVTALGFSPDGRYLWLGTLTGSLLQHDLLPCYLHPSRAPPPFSTLPLTLVFPLSGARSDAHHSSCVVAISSLSHPHGRMLTLDSSGKGLLWLPFVDGEEADVHSHSMVFRLPPGWASVHVLKSGRVWASYEAGGTTAEGRAKVVILRAFRVDEERERIEATGEVGWGVGREGEMKGLGRVTSTGEVPSTQGRTFIGHDSGHVSIWLDDGSRFLGASKVSSAPITALVGPSRFLWVGDSRGFVSIVDVSEGEKGQWNVFKRFRAHDGMITSLAVDTTNVLTESSLPVVSTGNDGKMKFWDGLLRDDWLARRMSTLTPSYSLIRPLRLGIFTFNIDGQAPDLLRLSGYSGIAVNRNLLKDFLGSLESPEMVVFNFQELIDLSNVTLGARSFLFATEEHDVTARYCEWLRVLTDAVSYHLGEDFTFVVEEKLVGLYTVIFSKTSLKSSIKDLATHRIKTGFDGEVGNKGALLFRFVVDDTSFCFINAHLAAGEGREDDRVRDLTAILDGYKFPKAKEGTRSAYLDDGDGTMVFHCETVFLAGDLNSRLSLPRPFVLSILATSPLPSALSTLLPSDEITRLSHTSPSYPLRLFSEAPICFPPTYKYDHDSNRFDTSEKQRTPAWCDRVMWRTEREGSVKALSYGRFEADISDHRPVAAVFDVKVKKVDPVLQEDVYERVAKEQWSVEAARLLAVARMYYQEQQ